MNIKRTIIAVFILIIIGLGCIEASQAFVEEDDYEVVGTFYPDGIRHRGELKGEVFRIHDDKLNVTLYIFIGERRGGITAIPDSQLEENDYSN